jgi:tetratricopeptide (TPR) repeat protein
VRNLTAAIGLALLTLNAPAWAQRTSVAAASTEAVARGLEAQYRAALIRERRLADDRELILIADAETRMREARRAFSEARGDRAGAQAALDAARAEYARLVEAAPLRDATTQIELEAFRAELQSRLPEATPELMAAYQEFADGDRASAWQTLEPLLSARAAARVAAARAVAAGEVRQLASLREIMRINGEATAEDALALWNQAASLDASDSRTHVSRARMAVYTNHLALAQEAAEAALATARTPRERSLALDELGAALFRRNDLDGALARYAESLRISRELYDQDPSDEKNLRNLIAGLLSVADLHKERGELSEALRQYDEALLAMRELQARAPNDPQNVRGLPAVLQRKGDTLNALGDIDGALAQFREALQTSGALYAANPVNEDLARDQSIILMRIGDALMRRNDVDGAFAEYSAALQISSELHARDQSNVSLAYDHAVVLALLGRVWSERGDFAAAVNHYEQAMPIFRALHDADRNNHTFAAVLSFWLQNRGAALGRLGDNPGARRDWTEAAALLEWLTANGANDPGLTRQLAWTRNQLTELPAE